MSDASQQVEPENNSILRVYVAGSSAEMARAEKWMHKLRKMGIMVTSSWPEVIKKVGEANPMTAPREQRAVWAATDLDEVASSNLLWLLIPEGSSDGAHVEFGYAGMLAATALKGRRMGVPVPAFSMMCSGKERSIFTAMAGHFDTDEAAFNYVTRLEMYLLEQEAAEDEYEGEGEDEDEEDDGYEQFVEKTASPFSPELTKQLDSIFKTK